MLDNDYGSSNYINLIYTNLFMFCFFFRINNKDIKLKPIDFIKDMTQVSIHQRLPKNLLEILDISLMK
jgi:hypothetical protein